ncbi:MAG: hypothetical protein CR965_01505 [Paludibacter sp.]|nr:MAG: hypothetical protein CR965_01505 [Paludibacter sp.]
MKIIDFVKSFLFCGLLIGLFLPNLYGQTKNQHPTTPKKQTILEKIIENGDTIYLAYLREVYVFPKLKFKNKKQEKFYWRTVRDVKKALPYARIASAELTKLNKELFLLPNDKERKKYITKVQKRLLSRYKKELMGLTVNQGRMLMKLVDREQGVNAYDIIKSYKGQFSATFWNTIAHLFGSDLKSEYDGSDKDKIIERVIILVENGQL